MKVQSVVSMVAVMFGVMAGGCSGSSGPSGMGGTSTSASRSSLGSSGGAGSSGRSSAGGANNSSSASSSTSGGPGSSGGNSSSETKSAGGTSNGGGTKATGGTTGTGGGGSACANVTACSGSAVGTWEAKSSCLNVSGQADMGMLGVGCRTAVVTGTRQVSGTLTLTADGKYTDKTTTKGTETWVLDASCLEISGTKTDCEGIAAMLVGTLATFGYSEYTCTKADGGGCTCKGTIDQAGGIGLTFNDLTANGNYTAANNAFSMGDTLNYSYCVAGTAMTVTPQSTKPTLTGSIAFQKGTGGTGGNGGAGGRGGSGGGSGGTSSTGGALGGTSTSGGTTVKGGTTSTGGNTTPTGGTVAGPLPCDIYAAAATPTPCVAAYSMIRLLNSKYTGPAYQVRKGGTWDKTKGPSGGTTKDIDFVGGYGDAASQDDFCSGGTCTVSILYDQSGKGNHLKTAPPGCYAGGDGAAAEADKEAVASRRPLKVNGHNVYALQTISHDGYRNNAATDMVKGTAAQGIYMVADGKKAGTTCCWDFGNAMPSNCADGTGSMDALMLGTGGFGKGAGNGPWFIGDFEFGVWACGSQSTSQGCTNPDLPSMNTTEFAFGILKTNTLNGAGQYCIRVADPKDSVLKTAYDGKAPQNWHLGGAIILGIGGDNSNWSFGTFFEGVITAGRPADEVDAQVYASFQAAKYGQ
jgi:hypothetical protein